MARHASALYLDEEQNISFRARIYSQAAIRLENSQTDTIPAVKTGQLIQHRNFYNPELDAKLTSYTSWMKGGGLGFLAPDDLSLRVAGWGFYDGVYDYASSQFDEARRRVNSTYPNYLASSRSAFVLEGAEFNADGATFADIFPGHEVKNPRDIYASQRRINELYLSYGKGPFFLRVGRQAISWGESDTIALLDQNNPFDVTLSAPGIFQDLDEARIPLWTVRTSMNLFDTLGPLSSGFIEGYWVPGDLDVNTGTIPIQTASPFSVRGADPQSQLGPINQQFVLFDHVPRKRMDNSRWGVRVQTVVNRELTLSAWYYTHFPNAPVPKKNPRPKKAPLFVVETVHDLTAVTGVAGTFFLEPLDGIVRMEAEYFDNEPAFTPEVNLGIGGPDPFGAVGSLPKADYLRWELGFDRFFFLRFLNPTNSFTLVTAMVGSWNLSETKYHDYRMNGQNKPGTSGQDPNDFVQQKKVEAFAQAHLQTDYLHGRLSPGITYIQNARGTYAILPSVTYRWTDWLLFRLDFIEIGGDYAQAGFFRDRRQVSLRATYQLN
ncbi:MAG: DUF1302 family protein [Deltaproteobacteria bacterium]|nr:DUF1302 family protein [Deltaproteobacteria bacterium]